MKPTCWVTCLVLAALAAAVAAGQDDARRPAASGTERLFPGDGRLDRKVSLRAPRIYLGELLQDLRGQSGVRLALAEPDAPPGGIQLVALAREQPLRDLMAALQELLSHPFNRWRWRPAGRAEEAYTLHPERSFAAAAAAARQAVFEQWLADCLTFHEVAGLPEPERSARAAGRPDLFGMGRARGDLAALLGSLDRAQLERALRGEKVPLDPDGLSGPARAAFERQRQQAVPLPAELDEPIAAVSVQWESDNLAPVLSLRIGAGKQNAFGGDLWDSQWRRRIGEGWRDLSDPGIRRLGMAGRHDPAVRESARNSNLPVWLDYAAERQQLNVLADWVFPQERSTYFAWLGRTPEQTVYAVVGKNVDVTRQAGEIHLLRHISAMVHPREHLVPWPTIRALRAACVENDGFLGLAELCSVGGLTGAQHYALREEFPDAGRIHGWRPVWLFALALRAPERRLLEGAEGLPVRRAPDAVRQALLVTTGRQPEIFGLTLLAEPGAAVRLAVERTGEGDTQGREVVWEVRLPGAPNPHRQALALEPRRPLKPETRPVAPPAGG